MSEKQIMPLLCERLKLKKKYLEAAFEQVAGIKPWRVRQIANGQALEDDWPFREVLLTAIDLQYKEMRTSPAPNRYRKTKRASAKYKAQRAEKAKRFKETGEKVIEELAPFVAKMRVLNVPPMPQLHIDREFISLWRLREQRIEEAKAAFYKLSLERAYVLSRNPEAFSVLDAPEIAEFCHCILRLGKEQREDMKSRLFKKCETQTVGEIVALLESVQVQQWCRLANPQYQKSFSVQFSREFETHRGKSMKPRTAAQSAMMDEAWSKFSHAVNKTASFFSDVPMDMIKCTEILESPVGIELMIGFLCCPSQQRDILKEVKNWA